LPGIESGWDDSEQASHNGDIAHAVERRLLRRDRIAELGRVLLGEETGRSDEHEITVFDSTGLAIQDLAIGVEVVKRFRSDANAGSFSNVQEIDIG
jgi:ornithine cyclodeaminase/alanine dehydrogenase-like protein (mu-crystallin family)